MTRLGKTASVGFLIIIAITVWFSLPSSGVPILAYHMVNDQDEVYSISPIEFEKQMAYLVQHGYTAVSLRQLLDGFAGQYLLPPKPVVITFDDGYSDNYLTALPIMARYGMRATVFVIAGHVGEPNYMTWEQIKAMEDQGTEIGSHTFSHVALSEVAPSEGFQEVSESKQVLEEAREKGIEFLAYPYGKFSPTVIEVLQQTGYRGACTGISGLNKAGQDPYMLKRINVPQPKYGLWEFRLRVLRAEMYSKLNF